MTDNTKGEAPSSPITPTEGAMDDRQHMGFILRIFMHLIEQEPNKTFSVNLEDVLASTAGRQMQVRLDGPIFEARTIPDLRVPSAAEKELYGGGNGRN